MEQLIFDVSLLQVGKPDRVDVGVLGGIKVVEHVLAVAEHDMSINHLRINVTNNGLQVVGGLRVFQEKYASLGEGKVDTAKNAWIKTGVQMLKLSRVDYEKLVHSGVFGSRVQASIRSVGESRRSQNHEKLVAVRALRSIQGVRATSVESITRALAGGAKKDEDDWKKEKSREDIGEEAGSL